MKRTRRPNRTRAERALEACATALRRMARELRRAS
jgi:hypothetical protein